MNRNELIAIVRRIDSTTLIAYRMREALGLPQPKAKGRANGNGKGKRYEGARKLMQQRYGVDLRNG